MKHAGKHGVSIFRTNRLRWANRSSFFLKICFLSIFSVGPVSTPSLGELNRHLVAPPDYAATDAVGLNHPAMRGGRIQMHYRAEDFADVAAPFDYLAGFCFRGDVSNSWNGTVTGPAEIALMTTAADGLSSLYDRNVSADQTTVFRGTLRWNVRDQSSNSIPEFTYHVEFDTPFQYRPDMGNLIIDFLVDFTWDAQQSWFIDRQDNAPLDRNYTLVYGDESSQNQARSSARARLPAEFVFVDPLAGDATFDGIFDSSDLVYAWQFGEFEDALPLNSRWKTGDWNGDLEFTSQDLVMAFSESEYESRYRHAVAVPEPKLNFATVALTVIASIRTRTMRRKYASSKVSSVYDAAV